MRIDIYENDERFASVDCENAKEAAREALCYASGCDGVVTFKQVIEIPITLEGIKTSADVPAFDKLVADGEGRN